MKITGHRGARGLAPENTIASLQKALDHGVDEIEIDVRVTKDKVVILLHDPHLIDVSGSRLLVINHTYNELRNHKSDLATLDDTLKFLKHRVPLRVEVKQRVEIKPVVAVLKKYLAKSYKSHDLFLVSFSQKTLMQAHRALPDVPTIVNGRWASIWAVWRAHQLHTKHITLKHMFLWRGVIQNLTKHGYIVSSYTINNRKKAERFASYGLTYVITDYPDYFQK